MKTDVEPDQAELKTCTICGSPFAEDEKISLHAEAGKWLSGEIWHDEGLLCTSCLENRAQLALMYCHDCNT